MINHIEIEGHLTGEPVYRPGENGKKSSIWGKIGVYQGKDQNGNDLPSMFIEFTAFGRDADTLKEVAHKGDLVVVSGRLSETQSTAQDGRTYINKKITGNAKKCYKVQSQVNQQYQAQPQQPVQQYQAQPQQPMYNQTTNANQSMWG